MPGDLPAEKATVRVLTTRTALDARHAGVEIREIEEESDRWKMLSVKLSSRPTPEPAGN